MAKNRAPSAHTGYYWPCPFNEVCHPGDPVAVPIFQGPVAFFILCCSRCFMPAGWHRDLGLTLEQARARGLRIAVRALTPLSRKVNVK